jgi:hypothetical protein
MEWQHERMASRFAARADRFSQLLAGVFKDEHEGQHLMTRSGLSDEQREELRSLEEQAHEDFRNELNEAVETLRELVGRGDPLYLLATLQLSHVFRPWGGYYEPTDPGGEHKLELVAGLLASQPVASDLANPSSSQIQAIHDEIEHILDVVFLLNFTMPRGDDLSEAFLRFTGAMHWMVMRGTSYATHGQDLARSLFSPHDDWLLTTYGFTVDDFLALGNAVEVFVTDRVNALMQQAAEFANDVLAYLESDEGRSGPASHVAKEVASEEGRFNVLAAATFDLIEQGIREAATFSIEEIVDAADLPRNRVAAVLAELSLPVGSLERESYTGLFDETPLIEQPFLAFGDRYLLVIPGIVLRDPLEVLEDRLLRGKQGFSLARAKTLDHLAVGYLADMLPGAAPYTNLMYEGAEVDGLVLFEDVAFVVEGKGTSLSVQGHRGDVKRLERDIRRAVEEAWRQGARARAFILGEGDAVFHDEDGKEVVRVPAGSINEVFIVNPTVHELAGHGPQLARLRTLGLFPENELPWSVYINDLRVIADTCDNAAIFLHYLVWRGRLPFGEGVTVIDELDLWGAYLLSERFGGLAEHGRVSLGNSSTDFDDYYSGLAGEGPARRRPTKFLHEPVKSFVDRMASERPPDWRQAAGACLDLSIPELALVCGKYKSAAHRATRDRTLVSLEVGRVALVGIPKNDDVPGAVDRFQPSGDPTLVFYCQETVSNRIEIVWAEYRKPVTFELSDFEREAFNAPQVSPFSPSRVDSAA